MNKQSKKILLLALPVIVIGIIFFSSTEPLNRDSSLFDRFETESKALIDTVARNNLPENKVGPLKVGWAKGDITPASGTPTLGYGNRLGQGAFESNGALRAVAFALKTGEEKTLVLISADLCFWPNHLSEKLAKRVSDVLEREQLFFGATHTHDGPGAIVESTLLEVMFGAYSPETVETILQGAEHAIRMSLRNLSPGGIRVHEIKQPQFVVNRTTSQQAVSNTAVVLELENENKQRAALITYPAHATVIAPYPIVSSADYPGALSRSLESEGWDLVGFFAAETGQTGPKLNGELAQAPGTELAQQYGESLAKSISTFIKRNTQAFTNVGLMKVIRSPLKLPEWQFRLPMVDRILSPELVNSVLGGQKPNAHIHAVSLNELLLIGHGFELSGEKGFEARAQAKAQGKILVPLSFNGAHHFYVVPETSFDAEGYEPGMTFFGPHLANYIENMNKYVIRALSLDN